jgi:hypothetical protein
LCSMDFSKTITVANKFSAAILSKEMVKEARLYYALRFLDRDGSGNFDLDEVYRQLGDKSPTTFLLQRRYLKERIEKGSGIFWYIKDGRLWLLGLEKVMFNLGGESFGKYASELTFDDVFTSHKRFKRALYEVIHCVGTDHPIARATIEAITGLGRRAQRNLESDICVEENFARTNLFYNEKNLESVRWYKPHAFRMVAKAGLNTCGFIAFQIANTYTPFRRETKKVSRSIRGKNIKLRLLAGKSKGQNRDYELEKFLVYGTTEKETKIIRNGNKRAHFTYYYKGGQWKALLPGDLYEGTYNKGYDEISAQFARLGICLTDSSDVVVPS